MATNLPTDIDATYEDRNEGDRTHQQHHDEIHAYTNGHDSAADPHGDRAYTDTAVQNATTSEEGFRARRASTAQPLSASTHTTVVFNATDRDDGADFDTATGEWTVPATGWYDVATYITFSSQSDGDRHIVSIRVNGFDHSRVADGRTGAAGGVIDGGGLLMHLAAGDVVTVVAWRTAAGDIDPGGTVTYFTAKRRYVV